MAGSREIERRKVEVFQVEITTFCHATEDCLRVEHAIKNLLPQELRNTINISVNSQEGYYGNPINILSTKITLKNHIDALLKHLSTTLPQIEKSILKTTFDLRFDPSTRRFIIRFSKQDLYLGTLKISDTDDVVKLTMFFKNAKRRNDVLEYLASIGLI